MSDDSAHRHAVEIARLAGRLETYEQRLERNEMLCSSRSDDHVQWALYRSEHAALSRDVTQAAESLRRDILNTAERLAKIDAEVDGIQRRHAEDVAALREARHDDVATMRDMHERYRRWLVGVVLVPIVVVIAGILSRVVVG